MLDRAERELLSKFWFLVEWDLQEGPNTYSVINWTLLVGSPPRSKLCTGKTVLVRRGKQATPANIVIMSDDKRFLDTELQQLRTIAAANLQNKTEISRKRRKLHVTADSPSEPTSSNSGALHCSPSPTPSNHLGVNTERHNNKSTPPMTFDQQTQTESKILNNGPLVGNAMVDNTVLNEIRQNQTIMREDLLELMRQMETIQSSLAQIVQSNQNNTRSSSENGSRIINRTTSPTLSTISTFQRKSVKAYNSPVSKGSTGNNSPVDSDPEYDPLQTSTRSEYKCTPLASSQRLNMSFNGFSSKMFDQMQLPWNNEVYPDDMVPIGPGRTLVPLHVMNQINWSSHSNATRRLLMAVFNRHILATHTLTGKASPAFHGIMSKPQKMRLDPVKISDIIQTVSKYSGVRESSVRSAITTKCADENKMLRVRLEREGKINDENKENSENIDVGVNEI